jgi:hypothetical protein
MGASRCSSRLNNVGRSDVLGLSTTLMNVGCALTPTLGVACSATSGNVGWMRSLVDSTPNSSRSSLLK